MLSPDTTMTANAVSLTAVVVQGAGRLAAVGVERLLGIIDVVIRPLPELTYASSVIAGATLDAEGNPQLVLNAENLVIEAHQLKAPPDAAIQSRMPILVIDDSLTTRMLEQSILESAGYEVDLATSGEEALQKSLKKRYGLFLVDVEMPGMDGFTFVETTRRDPLLREVPSILVTSRNAPADRQRGLEAGAQAYMVKSEFDQRTLLEQIRTLVG
jgi:two-component system chemotaxis sensor kinase CheA